MFPERRRCQPRKGILKSEALAAKRNWNGSFARKAQWSNILRWLAMKTYPLV
jgi:hypothetical protein